MVFCIPDFFVFISMVSSSLFYLVCVGNLVSVFCAVIAL